MSVKVNPFKVGAFVLAGLALGVVALGVFGSGRFFSRKLPGVLDWTTFPTVLPNSGLVGHHPFQGEVDHFIQCIVDGVESHASLHDAVNTHEACFAISRSARLGGQPVSLPLAPDGDG